MSKLCPMYLNNAPMREEFLENRNFEEFVCLKDGCSWWSEDAQKCAVLVIAESQRKISKTK